MRFQDQSHLDFVRDALWRHKPIGRATIMVGAGFSRNARPTSPSSRPLPQWSQMAHILCDQLYPASDRERHDLAMREAQATSGFLRLAQEFEAVFGRLALHECIRTLVPDNDYEPDDLHKRLLNLPWADIFTTNWDTLLERTCPDVFERSYDIVHVPSEIPSTTRPRIVKLHGSFPAHEPFIFTEEDFRTYPTEFASFVNLVQQSMMETVFCLIGFSGDDPNFLHWSGWVRDNLKKAAPKIYLVGWLNLGPHRRRMLEDRNVVAIDLAGLPQAETWPDLARHRYAIEWFLRALELGRPPDPSKWPSPPREPLEPPPYLGDIPKPQVDVPRREQPHPNNQLELHERLKAMRVVAETWRWNRELYPGWLVSPIEVRSVLWINTQLWINEVCQLVPYLSPVERLLVLRELIWRLDTMLLPLFVTLEEPCSQALEAIDVEQKLVLTDDRAPGVLGDVQWSTVCKAGETLAFALARSAREQGNQSAFNTWLKHFIEYAAGTAEVDQHAAYEQCLWALARLDYEVLEHHLSKWNPEKADPAWALRKAGILAEINRDQDARTLLQGVLTKIRRHRRRDLDDLPALSREAWALWLVLAYAPIRSRRSAEFVDTPYPFDRWRELSIHLCDAYFEYRSLLAELEKAEEELPTGRFRDNSFDLGQEGEFYRFGERSNHRVRAGYQMLRLAEITGLPHAANRRGIVISGLLGQGLHAASEALADVESWSMSLRILRLAAQASDKKLDKFFTRSRVALYSIEHIQGLKEILLRQIDYILPRCQQPSDSASYWINRLAVAVEMLSRITLRFSPEQAKEILLYAMESYRNNSSIWNNSLLDKPVHNLFSRAIETLPSQELSRYIPALFNLPIPSNSFFDPVKSVYNHPSFTAPTTTERDPAWNQIVARLIQTLEEPERLAHYRALDRLWHLHQRGLLYSHEQTALATALWHPNYLASDGFPHDDFFSDWKFLMLPESSPGQAEAALRARYLSEADEGTQPLVHVRLQMIGTALEQTETSTSPFKLTEADVSLIQNMIEEWARESTPQASAWSSSLDGNRRSREYNALQGLRPILLSLDLPSEAAEAVWTKVMQIEASDNRAPPGFILYSALVRIFPERVDALTQRLRRGLASDDREVATEAVRGLYLWLRAAQNHALNVPQPPNDLIREIGIAIAVRRQSILVNVLDLAQWLLKEGSEDYRSLIAVESEYGLGCLLEEASYKRTCNEVEKLNVPLLRRNCVHLALAMAQSGFENNAAVRDWIDLAREDPLPEVRHAFDRMEP